MNEILHTLNEQFALPNQLSFHTGPGNLPTVVINNAYAAATLSLAGAHLMTYRPHGGREVLWSSPSAAYQLSNEMRGGIPICWPWFAEHPRHPDDLPIHGLVRTLPFGVTAARLIEDGGTQISLVAGDTPATLAVWPHAFEFAVTITVGPSLHIEWAARNVGQQPFQYTGALHPYFAVENVRDVTVSGLENTDYLDKYDDNRPKTQRGPVRFHTGVDNLYLNTRRDMAIDDPGYRRTIHLRKKGSRTSVVWNPAEDDATLPDVGAGKHPYFVCVEAANAADEVISVQPQQEIQLGLEIECKSWSLI